MAAKPKSENPPVQNLSPEQLGEVEKQLLAEQDRRASENKLANFVPYPKQREFFEAGAKYRERLLLSGNQTGKTTAAAMELAAHATGQYWPDWQGHRFDHPIRAWACGETSEVVRETIQRLLIG